MSETDERLDESAAATVASVVSVPEVPDILPSGVPAPGAGQALLGRPPPSLRKNSVARLFSDSWSLVMSLGAATLTARLLGVAGKGFYSSLILLAGALIQVFSAGFGEAALVLVGQGRFSLRTAASATIAPILPLAALGTGVCIVVARVVLRPVSADAKAAVIFAALTVGVMVCYTTVVSLLLAREQLVTVASLTILLATLTTGSLGLFVGLLHEGIRGAVFGGFLGAAGTLAAALVSLGRAELLTRPRWDPNFIRPAVRLGSQMQLSNLLVTLTARVDLIMVYRLSSPSAAGKYSVALTLEALVGVIPIAISYALFPRLAWVGEEEARSLTAQMFRVGILVTVALTLVLAAITPFVLPLAFGSAFRGAIVPTLALLPAGALTAGQWLLARAAAARGRPTALWVSFAVNFVIMVSADFVLIPLLGATGAGLGSLIACAAGFATCALCYRGTGVGWRQFIPGRADVAAVASMGEMFRGRLPVPQLLPPPRGQHFKRR